MSSLGKEERGRFDAWTPAWSQECQSSWKQVKVWARKNLFGLALNQIPIWQRVLDKNFLKISNYKPALIVQKLSNQEINLGCSDASTLECSRATT